MHTPPSRANTLSQSCNHLVLSRRWASVDLLSSLAKLGQSRDLAADLKAGRQRNNKEIVASFHQLQTYDAIHYRKTDRPWELVPKYAKKRVSDLVGILTSAHRMEIEQAIDKMQSLCQVDMYVIIVPTVGYTHPRAFANSIFFDWHVGGSKGNGLLLVIAQHEANVQLIASLAVEEYFSRRFLEPAVREIFQPLVRQGQPSYATVQLVYAIARQAQEMYPRWSAGLLSLPTRNRVRTVGKTVRYGLFSVPYLVAGCAVFTALSVWLISQVMDSYCPACGHAMRRVRDAAGLQSLMTHGQYLEFVNGCAHYRVWQCPSCATGSRVVLCSRDLHQSTQCLKCVDCEYYTCKLNKEVVQLPTKQADGVKKITYECENCRVGRELLLPLYRPLDATPESHWFDFLVQGSQSHQGAGSKVKL